MHEKGELVSHRCLAAAAAWFVLGYNIPNYMLNLKGMSCDGFALDSTLGRRSCSFVSGGDVSRCIEPSYLMILIR